MKESQLEISKVYTALSFKDIEIRKVELVARLNSFTITFKKSE